MLVRKNLKRIKKNKSIEQTKILKKILHFLVHEFKNFFLWLSLNISFSIIYVLPMVGMTGVGAVSVEGPAPPRTGSGSALRAASPAALAAAAAVWR
jgi:hypothetical protein